MRPWNTINKRIWPLLMILGLAIFIGTTAHNALASVPGNKPGYVPSRPDAFDAYAHFLPDGPSTVLVGSRVNSGSDGQQRQQ